MIKGHKIYLRSLEKADLDILFKLSNEEKVKKYNIISDSKQNNKINLRKALSIVNEKSTLIGFITYNEKPYYEGAYSIGITIGSEYWGRKYGADSIKALLKYLFKNLNAESVELEVITSNIRAINCYKKCGFKNYNVRKNRVNIDGKYIDTIIMVILRKDITDF